MDRKKIIINAAKAIQNAMVKNTAWHIGKHADGAPALDIDAMYEELENARINGWLGLKAVDACNLSEWSGAMELVITQERQKQDHGCSFYLLNK